MDLVRLEQRLPPDQLTLPGPLAGPITIRLQSMQAARLVRGRTKGGGKSQIIGLVGFARLLRPVWDAASNADVNAYPCLLKVEQALLSVSRALKNLESAVNEKQTESRLRSYQTQSVRPAEFELNFEVPYAFEAGQKLAYFDELTTRALTLGRMAVLSRGELFQWVNRPAKALRHLFLVPLGFRKCEPDGVCENVGGLVRPAQNNGVLLQLPRHLPPVR